MSDNLPPKVLVVDSDATISGTLQEPLEKHGVELFAATDLQTALYRFNKQFFRVVFIEMRFPDLDGISLIQKWRQHETEEKRTAGFVLLAGSAPTPEQQALVKEMGKVAIVNKPLQVATMISQMQKAFSNHHKHQLSAKIKKDILEKLKRHGDLKQSISEVQEFKEALSDEYLPMLLGFYQQGEQFAEGIELLKKIPPDRMNPLRRLNLLGKFNMKLGNLDEARAFFEEADQIAPKNMERIQNMAEMYLGLKAPDEAIDKQKEMLSMNPDEPDMKFDMFKQLEDHGFFDEAAEFCHETAGPKEVVRYFNNKGVIMAQTEDPTVAVAEYERALKYYPNNPDNYLIHFNLALAYLRTRRVEAVDNAKEHLQKSIDLHPDFPKAQELFDRLTKMAG